MRGYDEINDMLSEDRGSAKLMRGSATIIKFPGTERRKLADLEVQNAGYVSGYLIGFLRTSPSWSENSAISEMS